MRNLAIRAAVLCLLLILIVYVTKYPKIANTKSYKESVREFLIKNEFREADKINQFLANEDLPKDSDSKSINNSEKLKKSALSTQVLKKFIGCKDKESSFKIIQHGDFWLLKNYVRASIEVHCFETITYTTHCDFTFFDNVVPLLERWRAPLSIAVYAPGEDFDKTLASILFLRNCHMKRKLVRRFASFHIFFESQYLLDSIPIDFDKVEREFLCSLVSPFMNFPRNETFKAIKNLTYPVNVGRNLAREAAVTHFVLASDIELYPNPGLIEDFFQMIIKAPEDYLWEKNVFVLPIFEVNKNLKVPKTKTDLLRQFRYGVAIWFHYEVCPECHMIPEAQKWIEFESNRGMQVVTKGKRTGAYRTWEPLYIGTNDEPLYDERLNWEGKMDKMTQAYIMCILDYDFNILSNAFLVHKPGIKKKSEATRTNHQIVNKKIITETILPEIQSFYGDRKGCTI